MQAVLTEVKSTLSLLIASLLFVSLASYSQADPGWLHTHSWDAPINNSLGLFGAYSADILIHFFGLIAFALPALFLHRAINGFRKINQKPTMLHLAGLIITSLSLMGLASLYIDSILTQQVSGGGWVGYYMVFYLVQGFDILGGTCILAFALVIGVSLTVQKTWADMVCSLWNQRPKHVSPKPAKKSFTKSLSSKVAIGQTQVKKAIQAPISSFKSEKKSSQQVSVTLLDEHEIKQSVTENELNGMSQTLQGTLSEFNIDGQVVEHHPGPVVTRYEIDLAAGTKVSKITGLAKDLARNLSVTAVRVVEVIPGKSTIGIEIPNDKRDIVSYREILESSAFGDSKAQLPLALGKDISGYPVVVDLAKMPHLLVAGTTGSGKSVGLNSMLLSLLYKGSPDTLKLIMIDPKMLELSVYQDIPHLLTPVVTDMSLAAQALTWCVEEMERRYMLMAAMGVRNISGYNDKIAELKKSDKDLFDVANEQFADQLQGVTLEALPHIVVVADEFADLIMVVGKKIEQLIARLAQKARASGIHIILATQRPSVDVITGLIKANIPTRIAFQVSSKIDSRTILDQQGAEQLLGNGDMLYLPPGSGIPVRIHGAFVSDGEVHRVCSELKKMGQPNYIDLTPNLLSEEGSTQGDSESDPLYDEAVEFVISAQKASVSSVQRKLRIGYNRAANLIEAMEAAGVISAPENSGLRKVLVNKRD